MDDRIRISQEVEIKRCAEDFVYFCETYVKINSYNLMRGNKNELIPFVLHPYQKKYVECLEKNRFVITKKFRQGGFSTIAAIWGLWRCLFKLDESIMYLSKTDREAIYQSNYVEMAMQLLPDWLKPKMQKDNDHTKIFEDTGCKMFFYTPEACCGKAIQYLFIDEAAFINDMDKWWKAMYPTISTGGHCYVQSTTNGTDNWFYNTYTDAEQMKNSFKVFHCSYLNHPDYSNAEWAAKTKHNLGAKGWRQEVLCEFLPIDTRTNQQRIDDAIKYCEDMSAEEELINSINKEFPINESSRIRKPTYPCTQSEDLLFEDGDESGLDWLFEAIYTEKPEVPKNQSQFDFPKEKPEVYSFKFMPWEEQKRMVEEYEKRTSNAVTHAQFDNFTINDLDSMVEFWTTYSAIYPDYEHIKDLWLDSLIERNQRWRDREDRINESLNNEMFVMAGLMTKAESKNTQEIARFARPDLKIIDKINNSGRYPKELKISFSDDRLCINKVPTVIKEDDLRDLYNGMFSLIGYEQAIDTTVKAITAKLDELFVRENNEKEPLDSSK